MFTGIVEEIGVIESINNSSNSIELLIKANKVLKDTSLGDSIAVNGICLTVTNLYPNSFTCDVMPETIQRSSLSSIKKGSFVNLERALSLSTRLGGHIVSGHIDATSKLLSIVKDANAIWFEIEIPKGLNKYIVEKGSIALDGISLTVAKVGNESFKVSCIPHSIENTILKFKNVSDPINIEVDVIGKYVEKMLQFKEEKKDSKIDREFLLKYGF